MTDPAPTTPDPTTPDPASDATGGAPRLSIVIPANDEAGRIAACLEAVLAQDGVAPGAIEVVVAANGCTDDTAAEARALAPRFAAAGWRLEVLDIPQGGKAGALNRGEAAARGPARAYLDADVTLGPGLLAGALAALDRPDPIWVTGRLEIARARSWVSRRYAGFWARLPFMRPGAAPGAGFFAVNAAGRARWSAFPELISDDGFVRWQFAPQERVEVDAPYAWPVVEGFAALVRVRRRQDAGMAELHALHPGLAANEGKPALSPGGILALALPAPIDFAVYAAVAAAVRLRGPDAGWSRGAR